MNDPFQLVTNCNFKGKDFLVQMCVLNSKKLELTITDKIMAEDWQCEYDASYIEALTHKTGNFKQFDVFVMMLKSGLLKTSDCITLDLLTLEDLEQLRSKKVVNSHSSSRTSQSVHLNKRYLILTYSVEFDRIHYPLPLDYCGPPDPTVLQSNIRKLESEIERLKQKTTLRARGDFEDTTKFQEKIQSLLEENRLLTNEIHRLNKIISKRIKPMKNSQALLNSLKKLEEQVLYEKSHNRQIILKLRTENKQLKQQMEDLKKKEKPQNARVRDASRYCHEKSSKKYLRNSLSPENSLDRKRSSACNPLDPQFTCRPVSNWNNSSVTKPQELKAIRKTPNRFLSSSSSESEYKKPHVARSREKKSAVRRNPKKDESCRKSSREKSRHSSEDSKKNNQSYRSRLSVASREVPESGKPGSLVFLQSAKFQNGIRSRESSLSSRGSSKHSKVSRFSKLGSGDGLDFKKITSRAALDDKEDVKFTMSDLETRIHSLQKLLSEGLHF